MMEEYELKQELQQIKNNNYSVPDDVDAYPYAQWMFDYIGSADAELRDTLIYTTLKRWIEDGEFKEKELRGLMLQSISPDYLFYNIGENGTDSVFKRAYSVLIPPLILSVHEKDPIFSGEQLYSVADQILEYIYQEQDVRGYVEGKGWAHSTAHAAEALISLARSIRSRDIANEILNAVHHKVCLKDYLYINFEDERLAEAVMTLRNQNILSDEEWKSWLYSFAIIKKAPSPQNDILLQNIRMFIRSLYFRALEKEDNSLFTIAVLEVLKELKNFEQ